MILDIRCRSVFKWQFDIFENDSLVADIDLKIWKEGADIEIKGEPFRIYRDGMFRGPYVLEAHRTELVRAKKTSVFKRRFEVDFAGRRFVLRATSIFRRTFTVTEEPVDGIGVEVGLIKAVKWYKYAAIASFDDDLPMAIDVFLIALVLMMWKRSAQSSS